MTIFHIVVSCDDVTEFAGSLASPGGILLGLAISSLPASLGRDITSGMLQGLAGGTFLFVTFLEVLPQEFNTPGPGRRLLKVLFVVIGFVCICCLLLVTG